MNGRQISRNFFISTWFMVTYPQLQLQTLPTQLHVQAFPSLVLVIVFVLLAVAVIVSISLFTLSAVLVLVLVCITVGLLVFVVDTVTLVEGDPIPDAFIVIGRLLAPTQARPTPNPRTMETA